MDQDQLFDLTDSYLRSLIAETSNLSEPSLDSLAPFGEFGIDSFNALKIVKKLEEDFGRLPKTLLFENFNISDLAGYFIENHQQQLLERFAAEHVGQAGQSDQIAPVTSSNDIAMDAVDDHSKRERPDRTTPPVFLLEKEAFEDHQYRPLLESLFEQFKNESSVSRGTRNIAPFLFIGNDRKGYFNCNMHKNIFLAYAFTGPDDYFFILAEEVHQYCEVNGYELNILVDYQIKSIADIPFSANPFGVVQRVLDLQNFTLKGGKMRRLRYQISKFRKAGVCKTTEYNCGASEATDARIVEVIDQWCSSKEMVNPLVDRFRSQIIDGTLNKDHRIFLTYADDVLQNVILITPLSEARNGYLMDLEFYPPDMPLGGLEFGIKNIIDQLVEEGCELLSLGATLGPKLEESSNADPEVDAVLDNLREQGAFNDEGNLQFKNKFRPENKTIFLCRPSGSGESDTVLDIIMMIADPPVPNAGNGKDDMHSKKSRQVDASANGQSPGREVSSTPGEPRLQGKASPLKGLSVPDGVSATRIDALSRASFNPLNVQAEKVEIDLKTDSWAQLKMPEIDEYLESLYESLQEPIALKESLKQVFPFDYFALTDSGRNAEHALYKAWGTKGLVPQNLLFPTCIFHQLDNGFEPREMPDPAVFQLDSKTLFKGQMDLARLKELLNQRSGQIAFACVEVIDNASGGHPVSIGHLRELSALLSEFEIPLVMDATRVIENACFISEQESSSSPDPVWSVVKETLGYADIVVASLAKNFCVDKGGLVASNDKQLVGSVQDIVDDEGLGLDVIDKKVLALSFNRLPRIQALVEQRMALVRSIWSRLKDAGVPVVQPCGGHCVLIDVKQIPEFDGFAYPVPSFLAWMYLESGIRAGAHSVGMQKESSINGLVRLAIPLGLTEKTAAEIVARLLSLFSLRQHIPELDKDIQQSAGSPEHAAYSVAAYHRSEVRPPVTNDQERLGANVEEEPASGGSSDPVEAPSDERRSPTAPRPNRAPPCRSEKDEPAHKIAIVGMAGRYPKAKNLNELWENLIQGKDCIDDMPAARLEQRREYWPVENYRGGFVDDVDRFDSLFFNISPREAEMLDPQERIFLEVAWETLEDAGYYPETLVNEDGKRNVGVFVGAVWAMYQVLGIEERIGGNTVNPNSFLWSIANRVSYWMDFSGPSLALDTACSSSLTAIYLACESLVKGECSTALAGGVNLDLHQSKYEINKAGGALSEDFLCRSFGKGANGYVAGEGAGALLLKPMQQAIEDRDHIHGVILAAAVNHGGRTSGYTVPSPKAQAALILSALQKAEVDAASIGYIEAHGTGTELGDPIEIEGLSKAFANAEVKAQSCAIGSVKSNIGHLEAAAGVVGVCKVLLQMRHGMLAPSLHSSELNEFIDFENSAFHVPQEPTRWPVRKADGADLPLRAGVSSFGAGGANAHIILEAYQYSTRCGGGAPEQRMMAFPLSARTQAQLREMAGRLQQYLERVRQTPELCPQAGDIAFTLQFGRKAFDHRMVVLAESLEELQLKLQLYSDNTDDASILSGESGRTDSVTRLLSRGERAELIALLCKNKNLRKLAQLWVEGALSEWANAESDHDAKRTPLPTYPFADKHHWVPTGDKQPSQKNLLHAGLHPLIDTNESTFQLQLFKKTFSTREFFIHDHAVSNIPTLPGVAYLEMARKAGELAAGVKVQKIRNIVWVSPLAVEGAASTQAMVELKPHGDVVHFEVYSELEDGARQLYSQGKLSYATPQQIQAEDEFIDLETIKARCSKAIDRKEAYPLFDSLGLNLGPSFQVLQEVFKNDREVLGVLEIPTGREADFNEFVLHPSLVDGSFQAGVSAKLTEESGEMFVPYSIGEVEILHPLTKRCYSYVTPVKSDGKRQSKLAKSNVLITDEEGRILVRVTDSVGVPLVDVHEKPQAERSDDFARLYYSLVWNHSPLKHDAPAIDTPLVLFDTDEKLRDSYLERNGTKASHKIVLVLPGERFEALDEQTYQVNPGNADDYVKLLDALDVEQQLDLNICFAWGAQFDLGSVAAPDDSKLDDELALGVYSLLLLCQSLMQRDKPKLSRLVYLYHVQDGQPEPLNEAINGFLKTLHLEHAKLFDCKTVALSPALTGCPEALDIVFSELTQSGKDAVAVRYRDDQREIRKLSSFDLKKADGSTGAEKTLIRDNGCYLITGGAGGLGLIFAEYLVERFGAQLVLSGRSELSSKQTAVLDRLNSHGSEVLYLQADISSLQDVAGLIAQAKARFGEINGVIHSAGVLRDSFIRNKTRQEMDAVIAPKLRGTLNLDEATKDDDLDFFVMFSSLAALEGNLGQCDYAYANHFMDSFAVRREALRQQGVRSGKSLSLNWSIWAEGGMQLDEQTELLFRKNFGIKPLDSSTGLDAFSAGLSLEHCHFAVIEAVQEKVELAWGLRQKEKPAVPQAAPAAKDESSGNSASRSTESESGSKLVKSVEQELSQLVMDMLKLDAEDIFLDKILLDLGFDSIGLAGYANEINDRYQLDITPVTFFEYPSIQEIAAFLVEDHRDQVEAVHESGQNGTASHSKSETADSPAPGHHDDGQAGAADAIVFDKGWTPAAAQATSDEPVISAQEFVERRFVDQPVAIVGMSGVMPQSDDCGEFWDHLKNGRSMITEIPEDRWDWREYYGDPMMEENKSNSKWGGFMREVDKFDPTFFEISPREAELMDPQQRVFLETVWKCVEDSGQKVSDLSGTRTGLFVGVATNDYVDLIGKHKVPVHAYTSTGNSHSVLVNRVSFLLNIHGPSAPLDTACSSSLVAIHRALESIHTGSSDMAIVGGVQVMTSPAGYIAFGQAGMLSNDGKCKTFDSRANGYVRGEGSGAIFLKPLSMAEADGNHIYAVIKSTAENHGGAAAALTAPNPNAQADLLVEAYEKAGIDPATVGYIECHGTGTSLGDPIEIQALKKSFSALYKKHNKKPAETPHCGLSSVKTNIGHLETAAGIAGILKVLLAIKHKQIPPLVHFKEINPYISLDGSPFYIVDKTTDWKPVVSEDGVELPRRAGVSSFGFGGANAHIVLEEYLHEPAQPQPGDLPPALVVLSAKTQDRLSAYATQLLEHVKKHDVELADLCYTLQVGRDAMPERLGLLVKSIDDLVGKLQTFLQGDSGVKNLFVGSQQRNKGSLGVISQDDDIRETVVAKLLAQNKYDKLLELWAKGLSFDWARLYGAEKPRRLSLPTYPFARERYWIDVSDGQHSGRAMVEAVHPLLHLNLSDFAVQRYNSYFSGREFFFSDCQVEIVDSEGSRQPPQGILSIMSYLEMARAAGQQAYPGSGTGSEVELQDVRWLQPVITADQAKLSICITPQGDRYSSFEIYAAEDDRLNESGTARRQKAHCLGTLLSCQKSAGGRIDLAALRDRMGDPAFSAEKLYTDFSEMGIHYGQGFQTITAVYSGGNQTLAELCLPETLQDDLNRYVLHPSLMEGALQAAMALMKNDPALRGQSLVPSGVDSIRVRSGLKKEMLVWVRHSPATRVQQSQSGDSAIDQSVIKVDMDLCDAHGTVCVQLRGFSFSNPITSAASHSRDEKAFSSLVSSPEWVAKPKAEVADGAEASPGEFQRHIVLCGLDQIDRDDLSSLLDESVADTHLLQLDVSRGNDIAHEFITGAQTCFGELQTIFRNDPERKTLMQIVVSDDGDQLLFAGLSGLLKTATLENPQLVGQTVIVDRGADVNELSGWLLDEQAMTDDVLVKYHQGNRYVQQWEILETDRLSANKDELPFREDGIYLITGGAGGLGLIFAEEVLQQTSNAKVILTGRSVPGDQALAAFDRLSSKPDRVHYERLDVCDLDSTTELVGRIKRRYGRLNGIIHCAGVVSDKFILMKKPDEFLSVLSPKVAGTFNLDQASRDVDLDFMVLFSSISGVMGNPGQADYAAANSFMDFYAGYRNALAERGSRTGRALSINWPLWEDGGMSIREASQEMLQQMTGMIPMKKATGLTAFYQSVNSTCDQTLVMEGVPGRLETFFEKVFRSRQIPISPVFTFVEGRSGQRAEDSQVSSEKGEGKSGFAADPAHDNSGSTTNDAREWLKQQLRADLQKFIENSG